MSRPVVATALVKMLHMLYEDDILSEESILSWHGNVNSPDDIPDRNSISLDVNILYVPSRMCALRGLLWRQR